MERSRRHSLSLETYRLNSNTCVHIFLTKFTKDHFKIHWTNLYTSYNSLSFTTNTKYWVPLTRPLRLCLVVKTPLNFDNYCEIFVRVSAFKCLTIIPYRPCPSFVPGPRTKVIRVWSNDWLIEGKCDTTLSSMTLSILVFVMAASIL
jgi:hypothetical protein